MRYVIEYQSDEGHWSASGNRHTDGSGRHLRDIDFPSLEAAQAEAEAQHRVHRTIRAYRARDTQSGAPTEGETMPVVEQPVTLARVVRIYRRNREWVVDTGGRSQPAISQLHPYMSLGIRQSSRDRGDCSIFDALTHGVSPQILSAALSAWYVEHPNTTHNGTIHQEEGITELPDANAYLALGNFIYKMIPVRQASTSKAIRVMREKVRRDIEQLRTGLIQRASQEATQLLEQARAQATLIRNEVQAELNAAQAAPKIPAWTIGLPVLLMSSSRSIYVLQSVTIAIKELSHGSFKWKAKEAPPVRVWLWLPVDGHPEKVSMFDTSRGYLPHIGASAACMTIGEPVAPIVNQGSLERFASQVARVHSVINLASLLYPDIGTWLPEVRAVLPDSVKEWLGRFTSLHELRDCPVESLPAGHEIQRGDETWSVR